MAADASSRRKAPLIYSLVISINLVAILAGLFLGKQLGADSARNQILTISLAGLFAFLSLAFIIKLRETLVSTSIPVSAPVPTASLSPAALQNISQKVGFTPREVDIAEMLVSGLSTQEILDKLFITPNTLKSHLRNIYNKVGARNRLEFTLAVMKEAGNNNTNNQIVPIIPMSNNTNVK